MARSARPFTRTLPHSVEEPAAAPDAAPPSHSLQHNPESFALQAGDDIENIRDVHCAYACLEKLVFPQQVNDCEEVYPTRSELGALIRLVNEELQRRIEAADGTINSLRGALLREQVPQ